MKRFGLKGWILVLLAGWATGCADTASSSAPSETPSGADSETESDGLSAEDAAVSSCEPENCDDGNACTLDTWDEALCACVSTLDVGGPCDDGNACTEQDLCDEKGACVGTSVTCEDSDPCTSATCDPEVGCVFPVQADGSSCNDSNACTLNDTCQDGICSGEEKTCEDDGNPCTTNAGCDAETSECVTLPVTDGILCDDGDACTDTDSCLSGVCTAGAPTVCDDGNPCTDNTCTPKGGCSFFPNTDFCNDGNLCTTNDTCGFGTCSGTPIDCNDGNPCTSDGCTAETGCSYENLVGPCDDGNPCTVGDLCGEGTCQVGSQKDCDDGNLCTSEFCDLNTGNCTVEYNTKACDDGDACTTTDACSNGVCEGIEPVVCDDGESCTLDSCDSQTGCIATPTDGACDDGNPCTVGDLCEGGTCTPGEGPDCNDDNPCTVDTCTLESGCSNDPGQGPCEDGNACTTGDQCAQGACSPGEALSCDDGNACTTDSCDAESGCASVPASGPCEDGNPCTLSDTCVGGQCENGPQKECDDENPCTTEYCDLSNGTCVFESNTAPCDDGNACTDSDTCSNGSCLGGQPLPCDDENVCTQDACTPAVGCVHTPLSGACSDGNPCTVEDSCAEGVCVPGPGPTCDDGNPCTEDTCTLAEGCTNPPNTEGCEDGNACTEGDTCAASVCTPGEWVNCDDGNLCTDDSCDPEIGCVITPNAIACDDGNPCTEGTVCGASACGGGSAVDCTDGNPCTEDSCSAEKGCVAEPNTLPCEDGNLCTTGDICGGGECLSGGQEVCTDANPCTADTCDPETGCSFPPTAGPCSDGSLCTVGDSCANGECVSGLPLPCQDNDPCTDDLCDAEAGCQHPENKAPCVDGEICTVGDACSEGECISGPLNDCSDGDPCTTASCKFGVGCLYDEEPVVCDDGKPCTTDFCDSEAGCVHDWIPKCCGNGEVEEGEQCDDGNLEPGDECDGQCQFETCAPLCVAENTQLGLNYTVLDPVKPPNWAGQFGAGLAVHGTTVAVGSPNYTVEGEEFGHGAVFVFEQPTGGSMPATQILLPPTTDTPWRMGYSVVMNESILAVMAPGAIDGDTAYPEAIFVYVKEGEQWEYGFALENPGGENGWIGSSPLVLLDNYLFAGVPVWGPIDSDTGAVVVYDLSLGIPVDVLEAPSGQGNTGYGSTLAGWGNRIAVGAYKESVPNGSKGVVYLYEYVNGAWTVETKISPSGESPYTYFGSSLAMTGNGYLAVSDLAGNGTVRMFKEDETGKWGQAGEPLEEKLFPGENQDNFGHRLAGGQDTLAVISHPKKYDGFEKVHNIPRAHLYTLEDGIWKWLLTTPAEAYWHPFNYADGRVALNENFLVVGDLDNYMFPRAYSWESIGPACTVVDPSACLCSEGWTGVDCGTPE